MAYWKDEKPLEKIDHRKGPDLLVKWVKFSSIFSWFLLFSTLLIWDSARPQVYSILDIHYGKTSRAGWDVNLINTAFTFSIITFVFTLISLLFNSQRLKRKYDTISISLVTTMIISGIAMLGFFIYTFGII